MESFPDEVTLSNDSGGLKHGRILEPRTIGQQVILKERLGLCSWTRGLNGLLCIGIFTFCFDDLLPIGLPCVTTTYPLSLSIQLKVDLVRYGEET